MYSGFYSSCGELDKFETLFLFRLEKTVGTVAGQPANGRRLPEIVIISYVHRRCRIERILKYGQETEQLIFKFETARKVGSSGLVRLKNTYLLNMD